MPIRKARAPKAHSRQASHPPKPSTAPLTATPADGFLSRRQAAQFAACNVQIIDAAIKRGELKAYRVKGRDVKGRPPRTARHVVISKLDLIAWATSNQV